MRQTLQCALGDKIVFEIPVYGPEGLQYVTHEVTCNSVHMVKFGPTGVFVDGEALSAPAAENFARAEGFIDLTELKDWYFARHQVRSFEGVLIKW